MRTKYDDITGIWVREDGSVRNSLDTDWSLGSSFTHNGETRHNHWSIKLAKVILVSSLVARLFCFKPKAHNIVDHVNGDCEVNAVSNLRYITHTLNNLNRKYARNVFFDKRFKKWDARVRRVRIGYFKHFRTAYLHAQAFKELLFNAIYMSKLNKHEGQKAGSSQYLHGDKTSFDMATKLLDIRSRRSSCLRKALQFIRDLRAESDQKRPSNV